MDKIRVKDKLPMNEAPEGFYKISDEVYFSQPQVSNSDLHKMRISPRAFKDYKEFGGMAPTPSMALGSLVHCMYLEPHLVTSLYAEEIKVDKRTKAGKEQFAQFQKENEGKQLVSSEVWDKANAIAMSLNDMGEIQELAGPGFAEVAGFFELFGVKCKAKYDYLANDHVVWDLKTTKSLKDFARSVANFGYHRQAAFYGKGLGILSGKFKGFNFVVVETERPYDCGILTLDLESIRVGFAEIKECLETLVECKENDAWPGIYPTLEPTVISLPPWYLKTL